MIPQPHSLVVKDLPFLWFNSICFVLFSAWFHDKCFVDCFARFFVGYGLELSRVIPLAIYHVKKKFLCKTEKELQDAWAPGSFQYETLVPTDILILMISVAYSVIAPLILVFAILYFAIGYVILRHQVSCSPFHLTHTLTMCTKNLRRVYTRVQDRENSEIE